jgi:glycosyltransferase involved in cell wall biosynthesis
MEEDHHKTLWNREKDNALIGESARVIAISNSLFKKYEPACPRGNLRMIHNGIDTNMFYRPDHEILGGNKVIFIYGGGYSAGKGVDELAYALAEVKASFSANFEFRLIGDCPEAYKTLFNSLNLIREIKYLGYQSNVGLQYEKADISFNCSACEAFGRKTVESMLAGNLVIASNTGGTLDILEHGKTGLLYQQGDPLDLMNKIIYALCHAEEMRQIASAGRQFACEHFSARRNAEEVAALYEEILREKKGK